MPLGHTQITGNMTVREAFLNVLNEDIGELFSRVETLEQGGLSGVAIATEEEAIQGQNNTKMMTPLRVRQAIVSNPESYLKTSSHTKSLHDSLLINADTVDGRHASDLQVSVATEQEAVQGQDNTKMMTPLRTRQAIVSNPEGFLKTSSHTKSLHDSLHIDADTVDGKHASDLRLASDHVVLQSGKVVDFADEVGDKIRLYSTWFGLGVNTYELTLYAASGSEVSLRQGAWDGTKVGDFIHTGNMLNKGVSMPLARYTSVAGNYAIWRIFGSYTLGTSYGLFLQIGIPWSGTTRYYVRVSNNYNYGTSVYIKINTTEYGPYSVSGQSEASFEIDHTISNSSIIEMRGRAGIAGYVYIDEVSVKTGNTDCLYRICANGIWLSSYSII